MRTKLTPYRFEAPVDDGERWDAAAPPQRRQRMLTEAFDRLARDPRGPVPPGLAALAGRDPAERARELGYRDPDLARVPRRARDLALGLGAVVRSAGLQPGHAVLDVGCGAGLDAQLAAWRVAPGGRVLGVDPSREMIARARSAGAAAGQAPLRFAVGSAGALPCDDASVDRVLVNCVLSLIPDRAGALAEVRRVLRPDGRVVIGDAAVEGLDPSLRDALRGWGNALGEAPPPAAWRALLEDAALELVALERTALDAATLLRWAEHAAELPPEDEEARSILRHRLQPLLRRLDGHLATVVIVAGVAPVASRAR